MGVLEESIKTDLGLLSVKHERVVAKFVVEFHGFQFTVSGENCSSTFRDLILSNFRIKFQSNIFQFQRVYIAKNLRK